MAVDAFINQEPSDIWKNFGSSIGERNFIFLKKKKKMMMMMIQIITSAYRTAESPLIQMITSAYRTAESPLLTNASLIITDSDLR